jgi:hypothetical protein
MERKIGIRETSPNVWRVTYDGKILGDSRGYSRDAAIFEAKAIAARTDDGDWRGGEWINILNVLDIPT